MAHRPSKLKFPPRIKVLRNPLRSERIDLCPIGTHLAASFFAAVDESRSQIAPWLPWVPLNNSQEDSYRYAEACERDWDTGSAARFFLLSKNTRRVLGVISLENCATTHRSCYLGYWLHVAEWGHGLMTEAAKLALEFAFDQMNVHRITCAAGIENQRSLNVIARLGFKFEGIARDAEWVDGRWISHSVHSLLESEWREASKANVPVPALD